MNKQKLFEEFKLASKGEKIRISKQMLEISSKQIHLEQVKGVVDKNFEAVDNFHDHIRTQHGRLP